MPLIDGGQCAALLASLLFTWIHGFISLQVVEQRAALVPLVCSKLNLPFVVESKARDIITR